MFLSEWTIVVLLAGELRDSCEVQIVFSSMLCLGPLLCQEKITQITKNTTKKYILHFLSHPKSSGEETHKNGYLKETANKTT